MQLLIVHDPFTVQEQRETFEYKTDLEGLVLPSKITRQSDDTDELHRERIVTETVLLHVKTGEVVPETDEWLVMDKAGTTVYAGTSNAFENAKVLDFIIGKFATQMVSSWDYDQIKWDVEE